MHNFHSRLLGKGANVGDLSNISGKSLEDIVANVPKDAKIRILTPQFKGAKRGLEYTWKGVDGKKHTLRIHDADPNAPINSNARNGWVARWQVGQQYYDPVNRNLAHRQAHNKRSPNYDPTISNNTHIPIKQPTKEQMDFMRYLEE